MNVLNQPVMVLNAAWQQIKPTNVKDAIVAMLGGLDEENQAPPAMALDQDYGTDASGDVDWSNMLYANPVDWDTWVTLPVRAHDLTISTGHMTIRAPRVIIQPNFAKVPQITPKPTKDAIRKRDGGRCQYTGEEVPWGQGNIDHVIPRDQGGKSTFENMVWSRKDINSAKANMTPQQAGLKLLRKPFAPKSVPISAALTIAYHPSWVHFMDRVTEVRGHKAKK